MKIMAVLFGAVLFVVLACAKAGVGESCETSGQTTTECVDGAICSNNTDGTNTCRTICTSDADCTSGQNCNGVSGSTTKSCRTI